MSPMAYNSSLPTGDSFISPAGSPPLAPTIPTPTKYEGINASRPAHLSNADPNAKSPLAAYDPQPIHPTARRAQGIVQVDSPGTVYESKGKDGQGVDSVRGGFTDRGVSCERTPQGTLRVTQTEKKYEFKTLTKVPKVGLMMVGIGGNNGTTTVASILANVHNLSFRTKSEVVRPNYIGSLMLASTLRLGTDPSTGKDVNLPWNEVLPMVHPNDLVLGGWDISGMNLGDAMQRSKVLDWDLQRQLIPLMTAYKPLPSVYYPDFIAANQEDRADNVLAGEDKQVHLDQIRADIREFKATNDLDKVIVLWTANTERYSELIDGVNDTAENLLNAVKSSHEEVSPSTLFAIASILEDCPYINGSPSNAFVPGCIELAEKHKSFIAGDDFKSGQTKFKSVIADFLVNAGIKMLSVASMNYLGNNDGKNLSSQRQFRSKEISKSSVVDDMVAANQLLYKTASDLTAETGEIHKKGEMPDHMVVIKYAPAVEDSKRAMDEYYSEIFMGGRSTISTFNICEDSLLATPLILDLAILAELLTRVTYREADTAKDASAEFQPLYSVLSLLAYMLKAPLVKPGTDVVNSLGRQRHALETFFRAALGLTGNGDLLLDSRLW